MAICNGNMVICDITLITLIIFILYLLTFHCAVLIPDPSIIVGCYKGPVHIDISLDCSNQAIFVLFILSPSLAIHIISSNFNTVKF